MTNINLFYKPENPTEGRSGGERFGYHLMRIGLNLLYTGPTYELMLERLKERLPNSLEPNMLITSGLPSHLGNIPFDDSEFRPMSQEQVNRTISALKGSP